LVDDDSQSLDLTKYFLEKEDKLEVDVATSAQSAIDKISRAHFDVIVADYQMPGMNGLELLKALRSNGTPVSFILFTGKGSEDVAIEALNNGADFYLQKGGDPKSQFAELSNMILRSAGRRTAQDLLRESEQRFREFLSNAHLAAVILDKDGNIDFINEHLLKLTGHLGEDLLEKNWFDLFVPEDIRKDSRQMFEDGVRTKKLLFPRPHVNEIMTKSGERRSLAWDSTILFDQEGNVTGTASLGEDTSKTPLSDEGLRPDEEMLKRLNEKLGLLGDITRHDVLNQLSVLLGWVDIAITDVKDPKTKQQLESAKAAAMTIRSQLEFTADYQQMGMMSPAWIRAEDALREGVSTLALAGVEITSDLEGVEVFADPMMPKVFHNLVDNSLRHGRKVDRIRVYHLEDEDGPKIVYEDNGVGISPRDKTLVFERGYGKHTGYGLHLSREILAITGIGVKETGEEGKGVRFELVLPPGTFRMADSTK